MSDTPDDIKVALASLPPTSTAMDLLALFHFKFAMLWKDKVEQEAWSASERFEFFGKIAAWQTSFVFLEIDVFYPAVEKILKNCDAVEKAKNRLGLLGEILLKGDEIVEDHEFFFAITTFVAERIVQHYEKERVEIFPLIERSSYDREKLLHAVVEAHVSFHEDYKLKDHLLHGVEIT